jgi:hypothetical protein
VAPDRAAADLSAWAASRAPDLLARAEAEAVAVLRDALVAAATERVAQPPERVAHSTERVAHPPERVTDPTERDDEPPRRDVTALPPREVITPRAPRDTSVPPPESDETGELLWAYCVLRAGDDHPPGLRGVHGQADLERVEAGGLIALVSRVPRSEFGSEPLRQNLNDLAWLERVARAHEAVLEATLPQSTIVPLRMCTLYESEDGVRRMLSERRDALIAALDGLAGCYEWAVKVIVDRDRLMEAARAAVAPADPTSAPAGRGEGGAYLLGRRTDRAVREAADALRADIAEGVHARLQDWAIDAVTRPAQNPELSGHAGDMALNGAYLVEAERSDDLHALVAELEEHHRELGVRIDLSGPWPPYNFVPSGD